MVAELEVSHRVSKTQRQTSKRPFELIKAEDLSMGNISIRLFFPVMTECPALYVKYLAKYLELCARKFVRRLLTGGEPDSSVNGRQMTRVKGAMSTMIAAARTEGNIAKMTLGNENLYDDPQQLSAAGSSDSDDSDMESSELEDDEDVVMAKMLSKETGIKILPSSSAKRVSTPAASKGNHMDTTGNNQQDSSVELRSMTTGYEMNNGYQQQQQQQQHHQQLQLQQQQQHNNMPNNNAPPGATGVMYTNGGNNFNYGSMDPSANLNQIVPSGVQDVLLPALPAMQQNYPTGFE